MFRVEGSDIVVLANLFRRGAVRFQEIVRPEMELLGNKLVDITRQELEPVKDTGTLAESVSQYIEPYQRSLKLTVGPTAPHTPYIQTGTKPHWVPIEPLKAWAARKLGDEKAAYAVQRRIAGMVEGRPGGTSVWAEHLYGTMANRFQMRVMQRADTKQATEEFGRRVLEGVAKELHK